MAPYSASYRQYQKMRDRIFPNMSPLAACAEEIATLSALDTKILLEKSEDVFAQETALALARQQTQRQLDAHLNPADRTAQRKNILTAALVVIGGGVALSVLTGGIGSVAGLIGIGVATMGGAGLVAETVQELRREDPILAVMSEQDRLYNDSQQRLNMCIDKMEAASLAASPSLRQSFAAAKERRETTKAANSPAFSFAAAGMM